MSGIRSITRSATAKGAASAGSVPVYVDADDNILKMIPAGSGSTEVQVVDASSAQTLTNKTLTAPVVTSAAFSDDVTVNKTLTGATTSTERLTYSKITLTPATTQAVAAGGSLAGVRGEIAQTSGKMFTDGFLFGVQGKCLLYGTMAEAAAARATGVLGQIDFSTGTLTAGQVSAIWGDIQGNPTLTVNDQVYVGRLTNSMSAGKKAQAFLLCYGAADFLVEAGADGGTADWLVASGVGGSQNAKLKVNIMGATYFIPLNTA